MGRVNSIVFLCCFMLLCLNYLSSLSKSATDLEEFDAVTKDTFKKILDSLGRIIKRIGGFTMKGYTYLMNSKTAESGSAYAKTLWKKMRKKKLDKGNSIPEYTQKVDNIGNGVKVFLENVEKLQEKNENTVALNLKYQLLKNLTEMKKFLQKYEYQSVDFSIWKLADKMQNVYKDELKNRLDTIQEEKVVDAKTSYDKLESLIGIYETFFQSIMGILAKVIIDKEKIDESVQVLTDFEEKILPAMKEILKLFAENLQNIQGDNFVYFFERINMPLKYLTYFDKAMEKAA